MLKASNHAAYSPLRTLNYRNYLFPRGQQKNVPRKAPCRLQKRASGAGIRRDFRVRKSEGSPQPGPLAALCRSAEKEVYLERRRGGGTTARAKESAGRTELPSNSVREKLVVEKARNTCHTYPALYYRKKRWAKPNTESKTILTMGSQQKTEGLYFPAPYQ